MRIVRKVYHSLIPQRMPDWATAYYERLIDDVSEFYLEPFCEIILQAFPGPARILDIGAGTGQLAVMLAERNRQYHVVALDLSEKCLEIAQRKAEAAGIADRVELVCMDISHSRLDTMPFDLIVSTCSLHHWRDPIKILRQAGSLLKPAGQIWLMDDYGDSARADRKNWIKKVEETGSRGQLFRSVFSFESHFLAYNRAEISDLFRKADLKMTAFSTWDVFFTARAILGT